MRFLAVPLLALVAACGGGVSTSDSETSTDALQADTAPPEGAHVFYARGAARAPSSSPDMTWHNGDVLATTTAGAVWWGASWPTFTGDKITGLDQWYQGFGGSNYAGTSDEYTGANGQVTSSVTYVGHFVDGSSAPGHAPKVSAIVAEACTYFPNPSANGFYAVYVDTKRGHAGYCAWHSWSTCPSGAPIQVAFFFNLDGDAGCDPQDTSGLHSQGLAALANVSGHELSEARTDPRGAGWFDSSGAENGDKCAWTYGAPLVTFSNATQWKIQGEWSNAAFNAGTGYPNSQGQNGCLSGQ